MKKQQKQQLNLKDLHIESFVTNLEKNVNNILTGKPANSMIFRLCSISFCDTQCDTDGGMCTIIYCSRIGTGC